MKSVNADLCNIAKIDKDCAEDFIESNSNKDSYEFVFAYGLYNDGELVQVMTGCMNKKTTIQPSFPICPECGCSLFHHKKACSQYTKPDPCPECGRLYGHKKTCSQYKEHEPCPECDGRNGQHYTTCSQYTLRICQECGCNSGHYKTCSKYNPPDPCPECETLYGHTKDCSHYIVHICDECKGRDGKHKDYCSKSKGKCPECNYSLQSHRHAPTCSQYKKPKEPKPCPDCGETGHARHKPGCPKYKEVAPCPKCKGKAGNHKKDCPDYKRQERKKNE